MIKRNKTEWKVMIYLNKDFSEIQEEKVFLVGSVDKVKELFFEVEDILQLRYSKLTFMCHANGVLKKETFTKEEWEKLQRIALRKLEHMDAILVLDIDGYTGHHTKEEIEYFEKLNRPIYYLSKLKALIDEKI